MIPTLKVKNTRLVDLESHTDKYGSLIALEQLKDLPFELKRVYYIFGVVNDVRRGFHSHRNLEQLLVCVSGSVNIQVEDGTNTEIVKLDSPQKGLYIGHMVWREMFDFSSDSVLLVLASDYYKTEDYQRDHEEFKKEALLYFNTAEE